MVYPINLCSGFGVGMVSSHVYNYRLFNVLTRRKMEAEQLNALTAKLQDLRARNLELRRFL